MTESDAAQLVGLLVAGTNGWDDHQAALWVAELQRLADPQAARDVILLQIRTRTRPGHPTLGEFLRDYSHEIDRREAMRPALPQPRGSVISSEQGLRLAWEAYAAECRAEGREPDQRLFRSLSGSLR